ncbi:hypothetical protein AaE_010467 [Aphanomyces astaci]|uniref:Rapamycin-insensitive companion of mTOR N-terminal domain-containing protein n=1 Tax=Aphanomyces astaci TaxID=112090 RepID=A0A6A5A6T3_APHAT|nr:hypothetical protein AaE_010467 [Aphanomyces astaci]
MQEMKKDPMLLEMFAVERIQNCARGLMSDTDTSVRTAALRVLRYSMINCASTAQAIKLGVHLFVSRSMERDAKLVGERIQALKVVRRLMDIDASQVPTSVVRSVVAIANHKEDNLRRVALETLRELAIANVSVVMQCNGIKTLVDCILDPTCQDLADALLMTIMYLINEPANRNLIHSFVNVQVLLAPLTDTDTPAGTERRQRWTASRNAIVMMMRSWTVYTGILIMTANPQGLRSLVRMLEQPVGDDVKKVVLATICDIFYTHAPLDKVGASSSSGGLVTRQNPLAGGAANGVHLASELLRGTNRPLHNFSMQSPRDSAREMLVYDLKVHLDNQMDDHTFRDLLMHKSRVLSGKDWFRWNWDIISELLEGPLTNPVRLSEAMKTKFFKRVSGFFRCDNSDKGYFAGLPWTPDYVPYLRPACQMYTLLLNHPEGIAFLKTDRRYVMLLSSLIFHI